MAVEDRGAERAADGLAGGAAKRLVEQSANAPTDQPADRAAERLAAQPSDRKADKAPGLALGPVTGQASAPDQAADQASTDLEIAEWRLRYEKHLAAGGAPSHHPDRAYPAYHSTALRHPTQPLVAVADPEALELSGPVFGVTDVVELDRDLTCQHVGAPLGERITVSGRVLDRNGRPVRGQLVEIWQANASGRYAHQRDQHPAPLDPNFSGVGRCLTDDQGAYSFTTIKPGAYPWRNHINAWRPAHIHFSLFGDAFTQRLVTQMYFPGDPLFPYDPILQSVTDDAARARLVATYVHELSQPEFTLGYRWDIVLDGPGATWMEEGR